MGQKERVLEVLQKAKGEWVSGQYFLHTMMLSQYHARIWELQKMGYPIEASSFTDEYGFKSYRLPLEGQIGTVFAEDAFKFENRGLKPLSAGLPTNSAQSVEQSMF